MIHRYKLAVFSFIVMKVVLELELACVSRKARNVYMNVFFSKGNSSKAKINFMKKRQLIAVPKSVRGKGNSKLPS